MGTLLFTLIPTGATLLYVGVQFVAYSMTGRMLFSSTFALELFIYAVLGVLYIAVAFYIDRSKYLRLAILGLIIGVVIFIFVATKLFLAFEFGRDLSI
jgi:hypothetical protein